MEYSFAEIVDRFCVRGTFLDAQPYGSGHINDTYAVVIDRGGSSVRYILQRINHTVFADPPSLMENISRVTRHLNRKKSERGEDDVSRRTLTVIPVKTGGDYYRDPAGNYWRMYIFIEGARTYDIITSVDQACQAAKAFGEFQRDLIDLPGSPLHDTIPEFHNGISRFNTFQSILEKDPRGRAECARDEIAFLLDHKTLLELIPQLIRSGAVPVRITHNDTKLNNVMIDDRTGEGICVIDLDTVMPGSVLYDFGDMVRTSTITAPEDERDLSKVSMSMPFFKAVARGYLSTANHFLNNAERTHLVTAGKVMPLIIGMRFLTDYLAGDQYFKTQRENHNLDRCRTQFQLQKSIMAQEQEMKAVIKEYISEPVMST
jgi:hypothetical protein